MTGWSALGHDPAPGDVDVVERTALQLGRVGDDAERLVQAVRGVAAAATTTVWRGPASDGFRRLLAEIGPSLADLAASYLDAQTATTTYGVALAAAQAKARRAEADGELALRDRAVAQQARDRAVDEGGGWSAKLRSLELALVDAAAKLLEPVALSDPTYHAALVQWQHGIGVQRSQAATRQAEAHGRQRAADAAIRDAEFRLALARGLGDEAADDVRRAAAALAQALSGTQLVRRPGPIRWEGHVDPPTVHGDPKELTIGRSGGVEKSLGQWSATKDGGWYHGDAQLRGDGAEISGEAKAGRLDDGSYGAAVGVAGSVYAFKGTVSGGIGNDRAGLDGSASTFGGARGSAGAQVGLGKDGFTATGGVDGFVGIEGSVSASGHLDGVEAKITAKGQVGIGGTADLDVHLRNGKLHIEPKLGLVVGFGGTIDPSIEIDVTQLEQLDKDMRASAEKARSFVEKGFKKLF